MSEKIVPEPVEAVSALIADQEKLSPLYYFYSQGCGFCKKAEPIIDELIKEGHDILKLDVAVPDNQGLKAELEKEYNIKCGTPWFINESTGKGICGFREKDIIKKLYIKWKPLIDESINEAETEITKNN